MFLLRSTFGGVNVSGILDRLHGESVAELAEQLRARATGSKTMGVYDVLEVLVKSTGTACKVAAQRIAWACATRVETLLLGPLESEHEGGGLPKGCRVLHRFADDIPRGGPYGDVGDIRFEFSRG